MDFLLKISDLKVSFRSEFETIEAVRNVSFHVKKNSVLGIVGESGSGKSVTAMSIIGLLPKPSGQIVSGSIQFAKEELTKLDAKGLQKIRGKKISTIFQEPMTALNPVHKIGKQIAETFTLHFPEYSATKIFDETIKIMEYVGIPDPSSRYHAYPHHLSGGMRQRIVIAIALACKPEILIADEPTTALDVTIQAQILQLIKKIQIDTQMAVILISHDFGIIAQYCDDVVVMYAGEVVESAPVNVLFSRPNHPYTGSLMQCIPNFSSPPKSTLHTIPGSFPGMKNLPSGCAFSNRCYLSTDECKSASPALEICGDNHRTRCIRWKKIYDR